MQDYRKGIKFAYRVRKWYTLCFLSKNYIRSHILLKFDLTPSLGNIQNVGLTANFLC